MLAEATRFTHNGTGGSGNITVVPITGFSYPNKVFGTSGSRLVRYQMAEYTDSTFQTLLKYESGIGRINLAANELSRVEVQCTWDGTSHVLSAPTALSFGSTAANILIHLGASTSSFRPALPSIQAAFGDTQWTPINNRTIADSTASTLALVAGTEYWLPVEIAYGKPVTTIAVEVTTVQTGSLRLSLFDWDTDGLAGNLLTEFTSATQIDTSGAAGVHSVTPAAKFPFTPGWHFILMQSSVNVTLRTYGVSGTPGVGIHSARDILYFTKTGTYGAAPSTGTKTGLTHISRSAGNVPSVLIK